MAKKMRRLLAVLLALTLCMVTFATTVFARGNGGNNKPGDNESGTEYVGVSVNGTETVIIDSSSQHDWLTNGTYSDVQATITGSNTITVTVNTSNGQQTYTGTLAEGYEFDTTGQVDSSNISGTNSQGSRYDNIVINITATNKGENTTEPTGPIIEFEPETEPTEPPATEPPATEPPATEPPATEPPATEPPATEPPATEPPATEPPATEPPATEPPATEPPATEPPATEPPATEPPATEPPATEPPATEPPATEPPATEPPATEPPATEPKPQPKPQPTEPEEEHVPMVLNDEIEIFDEDVPLAAAPKTGDISALWIALSGISAAGMIVLGKKHKDEE